jgi:four helix bundle protein
MSHRYQDLIVWQRAMAMAEEAYAITRSFPQDERFGLRSQIRRAGVSVPSNIAEGQGRLTRGEFKNFLGQARGSLYELETQGQLAIRLGYTGEAEISRLLDLASEVNRLLNGLISSLD